MSTITTEHAESNTTLLERELNIVKKPTHFTFNGKVLNLKNDELIGFIKGLILTGAKINEFVFSHTSLFYVALFRCETRTGVSAEMKVASINCEYPLSLENLKAISELDRELLPDEWLKSTRAILAKNNEEYNKFTQSCDS
ncbi:MAG: hypothetical protein S4CHLAM20_00100 [Chlamydiia bacterium]|nr:hypothetical protein [Chlamydiia bacterium]